MNNENNKMMYTHFQNLADGYNSHPDVPMRYKARHFQNMVNYLKKAKTITDAKQIPINSSSIDLGNAAMLEVTQFLTMGAEPRAI